MITTSPMVRGINPGLMGMGSTDCFGAGRTCRPSCGKPVDERRSSTVIRGGCGCSGLKGLNGMSGLGAGTKQCYDDGSCYDTATGNWSYPSEEAEWGTSYKQPQIYSDIVGQISNAFLPTTQKLTYQGTGAPAVNTGSGSGVDDMGKMWPLMALFGVAVVVMMAN